MDWIQFPFEVDARVHRGAGAPTVRLRWTYTDLPFLPVGTGCVLMNRIWDEDQFTDLEVGQLQPELANYVQDDRWTTGLAALGGHICHPEWLQVGEPWPNDLPAQLYDPDGLPLCCCVPAYDLHADQVWHLLPVALHPCEQWFHLEPGPGNDWIMLVPGVAGVPTWRIRRTGPAVGQIVEFRLAANLWNGRGNSPPFPFFAGTPIPGVPTVTAREVPA